MEVSGVKSVPVAGLASRRRHILPVLAFCGAIAFTQDGIAQDAKTPNTNTQDTGTQNTNTNGADDVTTFAPVTTTARRFEEPIQRIPFGITVFSKSSIDERDLRDTKSIAPWTPGFNFSDTGARGSNFINIRGVGSFFPVSFEDNSVPLFVDGVPVPFRAADREFFDVKRIEVLRGPQNVLYGRNAQAGVISVFTADPTSKPFAQIGVEGGNLDLIRVNGILSGPILPTLSGRLAIQYSSRAGYVPDLNLDTDAGEQDLTNLNFKLVWAPRKNASVTFALRYGNYVEDTLGSLLEDPDFPRQSLDTQSEIKLSTIGGGLTVRYDFGWAKLTSITGIQQYKLEFGSDDTDGLLFSAFTGLPPIFFNNPDADFRTIKDNYIQVSQEVRLTGKLSGGTRWVAGFSFLYSDFEFEAVFNATGFLFGRFDNELTTTSISGFGEVTVPITKRLRVIGGFRYTKEIKTFDGNFQDLSGLAPISSALQSADRDFDLLTGRIAVTYDILPTLTAFASISRGAKSGGFQPLDTDIATGGTVSDYDSAFTWAYEVGVRGRIFDGAVDFSVSVFFNDTKNEHIQVFDLTTFQFVIENLDTQTYGAEFKVVWRPLKGLSLTGGLALLHTEILGSPAADIANGNQVPFAPSVAFSLAAQYVRQVRIFGVNARAFGRIEYQYVGSRTIDPQNTFDLDSYDLVNLRAGLNIGNFYVYAFATNLLNETYAQTAFLFGTGPSGTRVSSGIPGQPRRFGFGVKVRF